MQPEPFHRHFRNHWPVYLVLLCLCAVAGLTLFQLTAPEADSPRLLLISDGNPPPALAFDGQVRYAAEDAQPEQRQVYVLTTGSGGFDLFCAPISLLDELYAQQLIRPLSQDGALTAADGTPMALPLGDEYALCLAFCAREGSEDTLMRLAREASAE